VATAHRPPQLRGAVFRKRDVLNAGLLTTDALRSAAWRRLYRGVYADAELPDSFGVRVRGARLLLPPPAVFSGRTAAYLHGATELGESGDPVEVTLPNGVRFGPIEGMRIRRVAMPPSDTAVLGTWPCTTALRTALDIARWEPLPDAVAALDVLLARGIVGRGDLGEAAERNTGRGSRRTRRAVDLADARAESPPESRLRVLLALAGLPAVPQFTVRDLQGGFVARVDLAYPEHRLAVEYDGAWHGAPGQLSRDRRRHNLVTAAGWRIVYVTAAHMRDPEALVALLRTLLEATPTAGN
jgi:very-short-patch-repair endonuclease